MWQVCQGDVSNAIKIGGPPDTKPCHIEISPNAFAMELSRMISTNMGAI